jgi:hypothetical protein
MEDVREKEQIQQLIKDYESGKFTEVIGLKSLELFEPKPKPTNDHLQVDRKWLTNKVYDDIKSVKTTFKEELVHNEDFRWQSQGRSITIEFISARGLRIRQMIVLGELTLQDINLKL